MKNLYIPLFILLLSAFSLQGRSQQQTGRLTLKGQVIDHADSEGISFATVFSEDEGVSSVCDVNGYFNVRIIKKGSYTFTVKSLGYAPHIFTLQLNKDTALTIKLKQQSLALEEFTVMGNYRTKKGSNVVIDQAAIEYVQPSNVQDLFILLPGNVMKKNSLNQRNFIDSRQVSTSRNRDLNTSLGFGVIADGIPQSNDGMRNTVQYSDRTISNRSTTNIGVDLRNISTDHISSVEVVRGIASAKHGNMISGALFITSKYGVSQLQARVKIDPLTKLAYIGKGIKISEKGGTLHMGVDFLSSRSEARELLDSYTRLTGQFNYNNKVSLIGKPLDISAKYGQTVTLNDVKSDEAIKLRKEEYRSSFSKSALSVKGKWHLETAAIDHLELLASADYTYRLVDRKKMVVQTSPVGMPIAPSEGEHEGIFLPGSYYAEFQDENKPTFLFSQINGQSSFQTGRAISHKLLYGAEWRYTKNFGEGSTIDPQAPPYPTSGFIRPRPNHMIPAMILGAFYLENVTRGQFGNHQLELSLGARASRMFNLPSNYALSKRVLPEPRIQLSYKLSNHLSNDTKITNTLRIGYGEENRLPTMDQLYPDKLYEDFNVMNAFFGHNSEKNRLITYTYIYDKSNPELKENRNRKKEVGWDFTCNDWELSITAFHERFTEGFIKQYSYHPIAFTQYTKAKHAITQKPTKEDYYPKEYKAFNQISRIENNSKVDKKGIEYRLRTPHIKPLYTNIEINGAYYKTNTMNVIKDVQDRPQRNYKGDPFPYVGIYNDYPQWHHRRLNTNIWINTHIPKLKLIFTNFLQIVWLSGEQRQGERSLFPYKYTDLYGQTKEITPTEIQQSEGAMALLEKKYTEEYYRDDVTPISFQMNFKATKELGENLKLSFFVDNILDLNPKYISTYTKTTDRIWVYPFFGAELTLNF